MTPRKQEQPKERLEKIVSIRMPLDLITHLGFIANVNNVSVGEEVREALREHVEQIKNDEDFMERAREELERTREMFDALSALIPPVDTADEASGSV